MWPFTQRKISEWTPTTYGIFENEINPVLALVDQHASLAEIEARQCPLCSSPLVVRFDNSMGTQYTVLCTGDPVHFSLPQEIATPPPWWLERYEAPRTWTKYARGMVLTTDAGSLLMYAEGWSESNGNWTGHFECCPSDDDFLLWAWIVSERADLPDHIDDLMLDALRAAFRGEQ